MISLFRHNEFVFEVLSSGTHPTLSEHDLLTCFEVESLVRAGYKIALQTTTEAFALCLEAIPL